MLPIMLGLHILMVHCSYNLSSLLLFSVWFEVVQSWHFKKINNLATGKKSNAVDALGADFNCKTIKLYEISLAGPSHVQKKLFIYQDNTYPD